MATWAWVALLCSSISAQNVANMATFRFPSSPNLTDCEATNETTKLYPEEFLSYLRSKKNNINFYVTAATDKIPTGTRSILMTAKAAGKYGALILFTLHMNPEGRQPALPGLHPGSGMRKGVPNGRRVKKRTNHDSGRGQFRCESVFHTMADDRDSLRLLSYPSTHNFSLYMYPIAFEAKRGHVAFFNRWYKEPGAQNHDVIYLMTSNPKERPRPTFVQEAVRKMCPNKYDVTNGFFKDLMLNSSMKPNCGRKLSILMAEPAEDEYMKRLRSTEDSDSGAEGGPRSVVSSSRY